jgi:hypothetical protein
MGCGILWPLLAAWILRPCLVSQALPAFNVTADARQRGLLKQRNFNHVAC